MAERPNQVKRTRKDLLQAAAKLTRQGRKPSLEEVAAEAMVSRATAYRYFPSVEALILEAALDQAAPDPETLFANGVAADPVARLRHAEAALHAMTSANEVQLRMMLANALERSVSGADGQAPLRQNRRTPLIEAALAPFAGEFEPAALDRLTKALALIFGTEAMIVFKDVLQVDDAEAVAVKAWAIEALAAAARRRS
jgi:AcrR family transcriptional regulator